MNIKMNIKILKNISIFWIIWRTPFESAIILCADDSHKVPESVKTSSNIVLEHQREAACNGAEDLLDLELLIRQV